MAMQVKPQKAKSKTRFLQNVITIGLCLALVITVVIINFTSTAALQKTIPIAYLKQDVPKGGVINSIDQFEWVQMHELEYNQQMANTWKDGTIRREILTQNDVQKLISNGGAYAGVYMRAGRPVYFEDLVSSVPQNNSYLYSMDGELLRLDITPEAFGDMAVPGDRLNVRMTYETNDYSLPSEAEYKQMLEQGAEFSGTVLVTETVFSEVTILDMLNSDGESIFDLYYELLTYPDAKRSEIINSDDFKSRTAPECILIAATAEEVERYSRIVAQGNTSYTITLLPRDGSTEILDALDELKIGFARD